MVKSKGKSESVVNNFIFGLNTVLYLNSFIVIIASINHLYMFLIIIRVPLQSRAAGFIFLMSTFGRPSFRFYKLGGNPVIFNEFKNSAGYLACSE